MRCHILLHLIWVYTVGSWSLNRSISLPIDMSDIFWMSGKQYRHWSLLGLWVLCGIASTKPYLVGTLWDCQLQNIYCGYSAGLPAPKPFLWVLCEIACTKTDLVATLWDCLLKTYLVSTLWDCLPKTSYGYSVVLNQNISCGYSVGLPAPKHILWVLCRIACTKTYLLGTLWDCLHQNISCEYSVGLPAPKHILWVLCGIACTKTSFGYSLGLLALKHILCVLHWIASTKTYRVGTPWEHIL